MTIKNTYCRYGICLFSQRTLKTHTHTRAQWNCKQLSVLQLNSCKLQVASCQRQVASCIKWQFYSWQSALPSVFNWHSQISHICATAGVAKCRQNEMWNSEMVSNSCLLFRFAGPVICVINKKASWQLCVSVVRDLLDYGQQLKKCWHY